MRDDEVEEHWRAFIESTTQIIFTIDRVGRILSINRVVPRFAGVPIVGMTVADFVAPTSRADAARAIETAFAERRVTTVELEVLDPAGEVVWYACTYAPIVREGEPEEALATATDISERKAADRALRASEARYRTLSEEVPVSLWEEDLSEVKRSLDALRAGGIEDVAAWLRERPDEVLRLAREVRVLDVNRESLALVGARTKEEAVEALGALVGADPRFFADVFGALARGELRFRGETSGRTLDGRPIEVALRLAVPMGHEETLSRVLVAVLDLTERKRAEEARARLEAQLRRAQKMEALGTLAGGIAHDFNNILMAVLGHADILARELPSDHPRASSVHAIREAAIRARELAAQILLFGRRQEQPRAPVRLQNVISEALKLLRPSLPATIELRTLIDRACPMVLADPTQMHQVLMNLATNAADAMRDRPGVLEVRLEPVHVDAETAAAATPRLCEGRHVRLVVRDTGSGMDAATVERIFEPFFTTKVPGEGAGLGLSIVHGIVRNHEGGIAVRSEPGRGTTFEIYLPAVAAEPPRAGLDDPALPEGRGETVLVVDDDPLVREVVAGMLEFLGYVAAVFGAPADAVAAFRASPDRFAVCIVDLTMPGQTGLEVAAAIAALRPDAPVLLATGDPERYDPERVPGARVREVLRKPFALEPLAQALRRAIARR